MTSHAQPCLRKYRTQPSPQGPASYTTSVLSLVHTRRIALHSSAGIGLIVPINRGAARSASAIAIAIDSL